MSESLTRRALIDAVVQTLRELGLTPEKSSGRSEVWTIEENGRRQRLAIKTTRDRDIIFRPNGRHNWQTLDDVDIVIVAPVDRVDSPTAVLVYRFDAAEVRSHIGG